MTGSHSRLLRAQTALRAPFDPVTISLHWLTLALVLGVIASAFFREAAQDSASRGLLLQLHRSIGVAIWGISALRLAWRLTGARLPPFPPSMSAPHRLAVRLNEYGLYALLLLQPLTGMAQTLLRGRAFDLFGAHIPILLTKDGALTEVFHNAHEIGAWCFILLASAHAVAGLAHHFVLRDDVLEAMAPALRRRRRSNE